MNRRNGETGNLDVGFLLRFTDSPIHRFSSNLRTSPPAANEPRFRPPAEADSLILQVDRGCPHNRCTFCGMYRDVRFSARTAAEIEDLVRREARARPDAARVFLADGDVMHRPFEELAWILRLLREALPALRRVSAYANGRSILAKTAEQLNRLRDLKLHTLYLGLESGDEEILRQVRKGETAAEMVEAVRLAQECGLRLSVMILIGLGGAERSAIHAAATAAALNRMQPRLLSALRVIPVPSTPLFDDVARGRFQPLSQHRAVLELRRLVGDLRLERTVFRADHSSNVIPLEARLPRDRDSLLATLDRLLATGSLDRDSPGPPPLWL